MDWDDLRLFLAIARHGTLSGAARALGVTQPTMGRRLAAMEARTGARLLQRLPGRFILTPLGESLLGAAERIEAEALAAERMITGRDAALEGVVRITTVDIVAAHIIAPALAVLQRTHPGIVIELVSDSRSFNLSRREADIALRLSRFEGQEVVARRVGALAIGLYAARACEADIARGQIRLVTVMDDQGHLPEARWLEETFPGAEVSFRSNSREAQMQAALAGAGVAALTRYRADGESGLIRLRPEAPGLVRDIWMGVHADMQHMPRMRAVMDTIVKAIKDRASHLNPEG